MASPIVTRRFLLCRCRKAAIPKPPGANGRTRYTCRDCTRQLAAHRSPPPTVRGFHLIPIEDRIPPMDFDIPEAIA